MSLTLYPAIDMRNGKCVRLFQGDYDQETVYGDSPFDMAKKFAEEGAQWVHMVDLDGAKDGKRMNHEHVLRAAKELSVRVQIGGGIRTEEDIDLYLSSGVDRVILGSVAVQNPTFAKEMIRKYGKQIVIGLDAKDGFVATHGWLETSTVKATNVAKEMADAGCDVFICTDIAKDGTLSGPNVDAMLELASSTGKEVIVSGGVSTLEDVTSLVRETNKGIGGVIIGKALYENRFTLPTALQEVQACSQND
ncbi:1-(5-phosphoribosyl)-5-[(5-phosphoribosylamino)methylideneamino]imidazole-4-carboxamide isomerase [Bacillus fonticola]|uniref:1-(5-phosphoribosyl)-5-[(5- phosphoribosylamino)methylideneamino]imidazole-4- carboxamide isomerase n=1 Tax=Bacillus fonticola TaxID=2728853 RepID=UPI0014767789|nr:1-(5-phosphoribosyl)-5-[(5-phosphoribosylamino)methylideneamino]imidazole-4-carboxamide isomerase [Bacillus fonticola]